MYFTKILIRGTKGCCEMFLNCTLFAYIYFIEVKTSERGVYEGVYYCNMVKIVHKLFCQAAFKKFMK